MISLCMDSAYKNLILGVYKDKELLAGVSIEAFKKQSETIFVELNRILEEAKLDYADIDRVVITDGPGSYTGIRIAMTIAKVLCTTMHKELIVFQRCSYTLERADGQCDLDARSKRAYVAHCENGKIIGQTTILNVEELDDFLNSCPGTLFGDGYLIGKETKQPDYLKNFIELEDMYRKLTIYMPWFHSI